MAPDITQVGEIISLAVQDEAKDATVEFRPNGSPVVQLKVTDKAKTSFNAMVSLSAMALAFGTPGLPHIHSVRYDSGNKEIKEIRLHRL